MYRFIDRLSRVFAQLGGIVLTALIILTCLSVLGRSLNSALHGEWFESVAPELASTLLGWGIGSINGDFELVEAGMAFAIFAFLPLCQLRAAHASVDIFTASLPSSVNRWMSVVIDLLFAAVLVLIAWQLFQGMLSKRNSGQTTFLLEFPLWWAYALSVTAAFAAALVSVYISVIRLAELMQGRTILPVDGETTS